MRFLVVLTILMLVACDGGRGTRRSSLRRSLTGFGDYSIKYFIDPISGVNTTKLTLPKTYPGQLYLVMEDIQKFQGKHIRVRFKFGRGANQEVIVPAIISSVPGLTPGSNSPVLVLSLNQRDFSKVTLDYQLFDYNEYDNEPTTVVNDNRNANLYCRGLSLAHDPTSNGNSCSSDGEQCLYAHAKLKDQGLWDTSKNMAITPTNPQIALKGEIYWNDPEADQITKCLSDQSLQYLKSQQLTYNQSIELNGLNYVFRGVYQAVDYNFWEISGDALFGPYGLFDKSFESPLDPLKGYDSKLFPIVSQLKVNTKQYIGSADPLHSKSLRDDFDDDGLTRWMSGCNRRVQTTDNQGEHIGSCNVTAIIEVFYLEANGSEVPLGSTEAGGESAKVKLQLTQHAIVDEKEGILGEGFKACSTNNACGGDECCFNNRCWSKNLVTQCDPGGGTTTGGFNKPNGSLCTSDLECAGLACKENFKSSGQRLCCTPGQEQIVVGGFLIDPCLKDVGESCISKSYCLKKRIQKTVIIQYGFNNCQKEVCQKFPVQGDCTGGTCAEPLPEAQDPYPNWQPHQCTSDAIPQSQIEDNFDCDPWTAPSTTTTL